MWKSYRSVISRLTSNEVAVCDRLSQLKMYARTSYADALTSMSKLQMKDAPFSLKGMWMIGSKKGK